MAKQLIMTFTDTGDVGKSSIINAVAYGFKTRGIPVDLYDGDYNNSTTYERYSLKDKNGVSLEASKQSPREGCQKFNLQTHPEAIVNSFSTDANHILIDLPARAMAQAQSGLGDAENTWMSFEYYDIAPSIIMPIASDKDFPAIQQIHEIIDGFDLAYQPRVVLVRNTGYSKYKGNYKLVNDLYLANDDIAQMKLNPKFSVVEVEIKAQYDKNGEVFKALQHKPLAEAMSNPHLIPATNFLLQMVRQDAETLFKAIYVAR